MSMTVYGQGLSGDMDRAPDYGRYFVGFNVALVMLVGGVLAFLYVTGDPYAAAAATGANIAIVAIAWCLALTLFAVFAVRARQATGLRGAGAAVLLLGIAELALFGWLSAQVFSAPRKNLQAEQMAALAEAVARVHGRLPLRLDPHLRLVDIGFGPDSLIYSYAGDAEFAAGPGRESGAEPARLARSACALFGPIAGTAQIKRVVYSFDFGNGEKTVVQAPLEACAAP
ncbi:MAG: hypothetical protein AB7H77_09160 [Bdellovibrionales bacterium]